MLLLDVNSGLQVNIFGVASIHIVQVCSSMFKYVQVIDVNPWFIRTLSTFTFSSTLFSHGLTPRIGTSLGWEVEPHRGDALRENGCSAQVH